MLILFIQKNNSLKPQTVYSQPTIVSDVYFDAGSWDNNGDLVLINIHLLVRFYIMIHH